MKNISVFIRSVLFQIAFYLVTIVQAVLYLPILILPRRYTIWAPTFWCHSSRFLLRWVAGIRVDVKGLENLPKTGGYIVASKHQSAMETVLFHALVPNAIYILKKSLVFIPIVGWYFLKTGCIAINRQAGMKSMHQLMHDACARIQDGYHVIIFPEGTRTKPGTRGKYNPGVAMIYEKCQAPVVPVALNTGYFWPKNSFKRYPGTVTIKFLPPIEPGLDKRAFLTQLEEKIEHACSSMTP